MVRRGSVWFGFKCFRGMVRHGAVRHGWVWFGHKNLCGVVGAVGLGCVRSGLAWYGLKSFRGMARCGGVRFGDARSGLDTRIFMVR